MARTTKQGLDYFPVDTNWDNKLTMYALECNGTGLGVLLVLWQLIYGDEGYYVKYDDDLFLLVRQRIATDVEFIKKCIDVCLKREIFNQEQFDKNNILTSEGIQKRFLKGGKSKSQIKIEEKFLLLEKDDISNSNIYYNNFKNNGHNSKSNSDNSASNGLNINSKINIKDKYPKEVLIICKQFVKTLDKRFYPKNEKQEDEWCRAILDCHEKDGYSYARISKICEHYREDEFWKTNFYTPLKLCKKNKENVKYIDYFDSNLVLTREEIIAEKNAAKLKELGL